MDGKNRLEHEQVMLKDDQDKLEHYGQMILLTFFDKCK